jgi:hypothetical protein
MLPRRAVIRLGGFDLVCEQSQVDPPAVGMNAGHPFPVFRVPVDPFESRRCATVMSSIARVLGRRARAEVAAPIVPAIAVGVVDKESRGRVHDEPVHRDSPALDDGAGVSRVGWSVPFVLVQPLEIGRIDERRSAVTQADIAHAPVVRRRGGRRQFPFSRKPPAVRHLCSGRDLRQLAVMSREVGADQLAAGPIPDGRRMHALSAVSKHEDLPSKFDG